MKRFLWMLISGLAVGIAQVAVAATTGDFTRCPSIGQGGTTVPGVGLATCAAIFTINGFSDARQEFDIVGQALTDANKIPLVLPYDGSDDALIGVLNMSGRTINTLSLGVNGPGIGATMQPIFGFDNDGLCASSITPHPPGCLFESPADPYGGQSYAGPGTVFSFVNTNSLTIDPRGGRRSGTINFTGGLANGSFAYFSLEDAIAICTTIGCSASGPSSSAFVLDSSMPAAALAADPTTVQISSITLQATVVHTAVAAAVPEPSSVVFIGIGLVILGALRRARKTRMRFPS